MADRDNPVEARLLRRTLARCIAQAAAWHRSHVSKGLTEAANNPIESVKRAAFGFSEPPRTRDALRRQAKWHLRDHHPR